MEKKNAFAVNNTIADSCTVQLKHKILVEGSELILKRLLTGRSVRCVDILPVTNDQRVVGGRLRLGLARTRTSLTNGYFTLVIIVASA